MHMPVKFSETDSRNGITSKTFWTVSTTIRLTQLYYLSSAR